jgi:hypothetical protein
MSVIHRLAAAVMVFGIAAPPVVSEGFAGPDLVYDAVAYVSSLDDRGEGTLRDVLEHIVEPTTVLFAVGGEIALTREIRVPSGVRIAGQSAPGGVTITGARLVVAGDDVRIEGMRMRPGVGPGQDLQARDGISVGVQERTVRRVLIERNSLTWAPDENAATWYDVEDVIYRANIIAEGLAPEGMHSFGMLIGDGARNIIVEDNLFVSNDHRNPQVKNAENVVVRGNVAYDFGPNALDVGGVSALSASDNVFLFGPRSVDRDPVRNVDPSLMQEIAANHDIRLGSSIGHAARAILIDALGRAGARPLDAVDQAILARVIDGSTIWTREIEETEHPALASIERDCNSDGVPDRMQRILGSGPAALDLWLDLLFENTLFAPSARPADVRPQKPVALSLRDLQPFAEREASAGAVLVHHIFHGVEDLYDIELMGAPEVTRLAVGRAATPLKRITGLDGQPVRSASMVHLAPGDVIAMSLDETADMNGELYLAPSPCRL